jgi:hypothetical protein
MSRARLFLGGLKSFLPWRREYSMSETPVDARYGYAVWLRHVAMLEKVGVRGPFSTVVELGPGNSVATGICTILSGSTHYIGLDVIRHVAHRSGMSVFRELERLFDAREPIPGPEAYPMVRPILDDYGFPDSVPERITGGGASARDASLLEDLDAIAAGADGGATLRYIVPWTSHSIPPGTVDLIFSQAALQEVAHDVARSPLRDTIEATARWLKPGGVASHQVDFGFYGLEPWNVHWTWYDWTWKLLRGRRDNFVNREPLSTYVSLMKESGLSIVAIVPDELQGAPDDSLRPRFRALPEKERRSRSAHLVVQKRLS